MNFDIERIKKIPKVKPVKDDEVVDMWCDFLGDAEYQEKKVMEYPKVKIKAICGYTDTQLAKDVVENDIYEVDIDRAKQIIDAQLAILYEGE